MNLLETKQAFAAGHIAKADFIVAMHRLHERLFEYAELLRTCDVSRIEIIGEGVVMTFRQRGVRMFCDPLDTRIAPIETLNFGQYEKIETDLVLDLVPPGATVLDVGANVGWYSLNLAKAVPGVRVLAFEPMPRTFQQLGANVRLNEAENIEQHNFGFSDKSGEVAFYYCSDSSVSASAANIGERPDALQIRARVTTIDEFVSSRGLKVDFIKCDVEGAELLVLRGAAECLDAQRPMLMLEMLRKWCRKFEYHPNDILALLNGLSYRCFVPRPGRLAAFHTMEDDTADTNFFFLHEARHAETIARLAGGGASA